MRATALAVVVGLVAASCSSGGGNKSTTAASAKLAALETTLGQAYVGGPLAGATVTLYRASGAKIPAAGAYDATTSPGGFFTLHPKKLPSSFTVAVSDGMLNGSVFTGTVNAVQGNYDGVSGIGANPVTSVVAAYHDSDKSKPLSAVESAVRSSLDIAPTVDIGMGLAQDQSAFSGKAFLDQATAAGGFDAYVKAVASDVASGKPVPSFAGAPVNEPGIGDVLSVALKMAQVGYCVTTTSTTQPGEDILLGCTMKALTGGAGSDPAVLAALQQINKQLNVISDQLSSVDKKLTQIGNETLQNQWNAVVAALQKDYFSQVDQAFTDMKNATDAKYLESDRKSSAIHAFGIMNDLSKGATNGLAKRLIGEGGATGDIRQYASLVRAVSGRLFRNGNAVTRGGVNADSIQDVWKYLDAKQAELQYLVQEWANTPSPDGTRPAYSKLYVQENIVYPYLGNPPFVPGTNPPQPVPPAQRTANCGDAPVKIDKCRGWRDQEVILVPRPLPPDTVVDVDTGLMWYERALPFNRYDPTQDDANCEQKPGGGYFPCQPSAEVKKLNTDATRNRGFTDWKSPDRDTVDKLMKGAPQGTMPGDWLTQAGGFYTITNNTPTGIGQTPEKRAWTSTLDTFTFSDEDRYAGQTQFVVDLWRGTFSSVLLNHFQNIQLWSIAVRSLGQCERYFDDVSKPKPTC